MFCRPLERTKWVLKLEDTYTNVLAKNTKGQKQLTHVLLEKIDRFTH